jgi:osmotically-inducible protein OsmY
LKKNENLLTDVQDAINWEPTLKEAKIEVAVDEGKVSLSGSVDHFQKKSLAENATKSVTGVKAVYENIEIKFVAKADMKKDAEILKQVLNGLKLNWEVPNEKVTVTVTAGWVTLEGELEWNHQKHAAKSAANNQLGVKGVTNNIHIKSTSNVEIKKKDIEHALNRNWCIDKRDIIVKVAANHVTLTGTVNSFYEKDEAERITRNAPGVWTVDNELVIEYH